MVFVRLHMTPSPLSFETSMPARDALEEFRRRRIRHAPVLERGALLGIVTERDLVRVLPGTVADYEGAQGLRASRTTVAMAMTKNPICVSPNDHIDDVARLLRDKKISAVPVVSDSKLVGILTSSDLFDAFEAMFSGQPGKRFTLLRPPGANYNPGFDLVRCAVDLGIELHSLVRAGHSRGGEVLTVYVEGDVDRLEEFRTRAEDNGYVLLEKDDRRLKRPA
ncbi:MAG TPA: CBS domain-containing protein [Planctomycetes bacterium]|nr:CBS domain-containing protein [Planctomycetota bacterium]